MEKRGYSASFLKKVGEFGRSNLPRLEPVSKLNKINFRIEIIDNSENIYYQNLVSKSNEHDNCLVFRVMDDFSLNMNNDHFYIIGATRPGLITPKIFFCKLTYITMLECDFESFLCI